MTCDEKVLCLVRNNNYNNVRIKDPGTNKVMLIMFVDRRIILSDYSTRPNCHSSSTLPRNFETPEEENAASEDLSETY